jgi:hypothetical protein
MDDIPAGLALPGSFASATVAPTLSPSPIVDDAVLIKASWSGGSGFVHFYGGSQWPSGGGMPLVQDKSQATQWQLHDWDPNQKNGYLKTWFGDWAAWSWLSWVRGGGALPSGLPVQARYRASAVRWQLKDDGLLVPMDMPDHRLGIYPGNTYFTHSLNPDTNPLQCSIEPV